MENKANSLIGAPHILSLDIATNTGFAIYENGIITKYGLWKLDKQCRYNRRNGLSEYIKQIIDQYKITVIIAEDIFFNPKKPKAYSALKELQKVLKVVCQQTDIPLELITPIDAKRSTTGNSVAFKEQVVSVINSYGYDLGTVKVDDIADAISIMLTYLKRYYLPITHPK